MAIAQRRVWLSIEQEIEAGDTFEIININEAFFVESTLHISLEKGDEILTFESKVRKKMSGLSWNVFGKVPANINYNYINEISTGNVKIKITNNDVQTIKLRTTYFYR